MNGKIPLSERRGDIALLAYLCFNLLFVTYMQGFEQLVIADPANFEYPSWPPAFMVDMVHWWGRNFDPLLMARPTWWKTTIAIDVTFFGPFYVFAIYAFFRGRDWIRIPSIMYACIMLTMVAIISAEELFGEHASPHPVIVLLANGPWAGFPVYLIYRMALNPHPFSRPVAELTTRPELLPA